MALFVLASSAVEYLISPKKTLTQQLRELEEDEIIIRKVYNQVPPKVEYYLSEEGKTLREVLIAMAI